MTNCSPIQLVNNPATAEIYTTWYNFVRQHKTLRIAPAMAAGLSDKLWSMGDVVALIDARAEPAKARGPYKKKGAQAVA